jgi:hypothetical protein
MYRIPAEEPEFEFDFNPELIERIARDLAKQINKKTLQELEQEIKDSDKTETTDTT